MTLEQRYPEFFSSPQQKEVEKRVKKAFSHIRQKNYFDKNIKNGKTKA